MPVALLGVKGVIGITLLSIVGIFCMLGIIFSAINVDKYSLISVVCHLVSGWSLLIGAGNLINNSGLNSLIYMILGGVMYTIGSILYGVGAKKKYMHSAFHFFCILGSLFHFLAIYLYMI